MEGLSLEVVDSAAVEISVAVEADSREPVNKEEEGNSKTSTTTTEAVEEAEVVGDSAGETMTSHNGTEMFRSTFAPTGP